MKELNDYEVRSDSGKWASNKLVAVNDEPESPRFKKTMTPNSRQRAPTNKFSVVSRQSKVSNR